MTKKITLKKVEEKRKEAIKIREEARVLKKEAEEETKKLRKLQNPGNVDENTKTHDEHGKILPGVKLPGAGSVKGSFSIKAMIKAKLQEVEPKNQKTYAELLVARIIQKAVVGGDDAQIKNILQYIEGMPKQTLEGSLDVKTALVSFIGGAIEGAKVEEMEEAEQIEAGEEKKEDGSS